MRPLRAMKTLSKSLLLLSQSTTLDCSELIPLSLQVDEIHNNGLRRTVRVDGEADFGTKSSQTWRRCKMEMKVSIQMEEGI